MTSASGKCLEPSKVKCGNLFDGRCERCVGSGLVGSLCQNWTHLDTNSYSSATLIGNDRLQLTLTTNNNSKYQISARRWEGRRQDSPLLEAGWLGGHFDLIHFTIGGGTDRRVEFTKLFFSMFTRLLVVTLLLYSLIIERSHFISV